ncbi:MAG: rod-binding protein [Rhizobiaceae bacterium]|nr:rod-binding protein [Rhizobiaceae bacterium]
MAVALATDIVADVMRAASPERLQEARARLRALSTSSPGASQVASLEQAPKSEQAQAFQKFDAMVLGSFVEAMLPPESESVYGGGLAGDMWKSMLAQQLGDSLAAAGTLDLASRYISDRYADGDLSSPLRGASDPATKAVLDGERGLSRSLVDELQRKALDAITGAAAGTTK